MHLRYAEYGGCSGGAYTLPPKPSGSRAVQPCAMRLARYHTLRTFFVTQDRENSTDSVQGAAAQESIDLVEGEESTVSVE